MSVCFNAAAIIVTSNGGEVEEDQHEGKILTLVDATGAPSRGTKMGPGTSVQSEQGSVFPEISPLSRHPSA